MFSEGTPLQSGRDVTLAIQALEDSRRLLDEAPDAIMVHSDGVVIYANNACAEMFGAASRSDLLGADAMSFVHPDDLDVVRARSKRILENADRTEAMEVRVRRLDGAIMDVEVRGRPTTYRGRIADQTVIRDISDRKRAEQLDDLQRARKHFVDIVAHEMRTPITPMRVQLHRLRTEPLDAAETARAVDVLDRNLERLASLVEELVQAATIRDGGLTITLREFDLSHLVNACVESYTDVAFEVEVTMSVQIAADVHIRADPERIAQVVDNLLTNAFKFTPVGGSVKVSLEVEGRKVRIIVADSGSGIAGTEKGRLFQPFSQLTTGHGGTGLGLYICRGIIEGHGGAIECQSDGPGKGASFIVTLEALD